MLIMGLMRKTSTRRDGTDFFNDEKLAVLDKAKPRNDFNIRYDICNREIHFNK